MFNRAILFIVFLLIAGPVRAQVVINEFSSGSTSDWVEVINTATDSADLSVYKLRDSTDSNELSLSGPLDAGAIRSFNFSNYLNNAGDEVLLVTDEDEADRISYGNEGGLCAPSDNQSIGRKPDGTGAFVRFASATRDAANTSDEAPCPTDTPTKTLTPTRTPSVTKTPTSPPQSTVTHTPVSTNTQSPVQDPKPTSTSKPTAFRTPTPKKTPTPMSKLGETESGMYVLGESTGPSVPSSTPSTGPRSSPSYTPLIITFLLVGIGLGIIAAVLAWQKHQELKHE